MFRPRYLSDCMLATSVKLAYWSDLPVL